MYDARTAAIYDLLYSSSNGRRLRDGRLEAERIRHEVRASRSAGRSLLDVGCGTGRYLPFLADEMAVHGVDVHAGFLEIARRNCPTGVFEQADMEALDLDERFDVITCLFSSIAYVLTEDRLRRAVARFSDHLAPRGIVIIEPWSRPSRSSTDMRRPTTSTRPS